MSEPGAIEIRVNHQIITAMKTHDMLRTTMLRLIKKALKNENFPQLRNTLLRFL